MIMINYINPLEVIIVTISKQEFIHDTLNIISNMEIFLPRFSSNFEAFASELLEDMFHSYMLA